MTDGGPRKSNESESAYINRLGKYAREREMLQKRRERGDPRSKFGDVFSDDAYLDRMGGANLENAENDALSGLLGAWRNDIDSEPLNDFIEKGELTGSAARDLTAYRKTKNPKKRQKLAKRNKSAWKAAAKKNKQSKGCAVIALLIIGAVGGALYGSYEGVTALVAAL